MMFKYYIKNEGYGHEVLIMPFGQLQQYHDTIGSVIHVHVPPQLSNNMM